VSARLQIQFLGLNEGDDPKNLPPGTLLRAENCAMDKARRLVKRPGTTGLLQTAIGATISSGKRFVTNGKSLAITDGENLWTYVDALSKWNHIDRIPSWQVTKRALADSLRSVTALDVAVYGRMLVTIYRVGGTGSVYYQIDNLDTGDPIIPSTQLASASGGAVRVAVSGSTAYLFYSITGGINWAPYDLATLGLGASPAALVANAVAGAPTFDVAIGTPTAGVPTLYLVYELLAGTDRTRLASFTLSTMVAIATLDSPGRGLTSVGVAFGALAQKVTIAFATSVAGNLTQISSCSTALASQVGPTTVWAGRSSYVFVAEHDATNVLVGWTRNSATGDKSTADRLYTCLFSVAAHAQVAPSQRITFGVFNPTKPWKTGSRWFVSALSWVHPYTFPSVAEIAQPSSVVLEVETTFSLTGDQDGTHPHVATLENYTGWFGTEDEIVQSAVDGDGAVWLAAPYRVHEPIGYCTSPAVPLGWNVFRLEASGGDTYRAAAIGRGALLAGGAPAWFDGAYAMPYGFAHAPQILSVTPTAGGSMVAGTYSYVVTFARIDASGVVHRSAPSAPVSGVAAAADLSMTVLVSTSSISAGQRATTAAISANPVFLEVWRTTVDGTGSHYRISLEPTYQVLTNDPRAADVSLVDTRADANIAAGGTPVVPLASRQQLYTDLGELENIPPPSLVTTATHQGRLVGIGPDLRTVWLSKDSKIDPTIAPGFNEALTLAFSRDKTALASLDTVLVIFGKDTIDVVHGDGPDDSGNNNTWQVQAVQTDVGCVNPRSVVATPVGVMFESRRGLDMLDRGLNVTDVLGRAVVDTLTTYSNITSAVLVAEENEVRFTCDNGTNGIVLAFDYLNKIWFTRKYTDASDTAAASIKFVDAALIDGIYTLLTAGGQVYRESTTSFLDGGSTYVETDILLAPISAQPGRSGWSNDNLAWQRVKDLTLMGTSVANHDLAVSFALNYANTFGQTHRFLANTVGTPTAVGPLEKARVTANVQKCQAFQIRIRDLAPTGNSVVGNASAGVILESLCLRVGAKDGPAKTTAGQQA
jgi:hypothetical protein